MERPAIVSKQTQNQPSVPTPNCISHSRKVFLMPRFHPEVWERLALVSCILRCCRGGVSALTAEYNHLGLLKLLEAQAAPQAN